MSNSLKGVEIFDVGTWNGYTFSDGDLNEIASSFDELKLAGRVPLKFGHKGAMRGDDSQPAIGWVDTVYRKGSKLLADFVDIPTSVYDSIKKGLYKFVSVELLDSVKAGTRTLPWVLDAVALLGASRPAVSTLKDLKSLTYAHETLGLEYGAVKSFTRDSVINSMERHKMSNEDNGGAIRELTDKVMELTNKVTALSDENRTLKAEKAKFSQLESRFESLQEEVTKRDVTTKRSQINGLLEAAVRDEKITPAAKLRFSKAYRVDDDEAVMTIDEKDVEEFVRENPHPNPKKREVRRSTFSLHDPDGEVPAGTKPNQELRLRTFARLSKKGIHSPTDVQLQQEAQAVLRENGELSEGWKYEADKFYADAAAR